MNRGGTPLLRDFGVSTEHRCRGWKPLPRCFGVFLSLLSAEAEPQADL